MRKDKPQISPNDWLIYDKKSLVAWVSRFLWHYEGMASGNGPEEPPDNPGLIIVESIIKAFPLLSGEKIEPIRLPDPETYFQAEGDH